MDEKYDELTMQKLILEFIKSESGLVSGYFILLLLNTIVSVVGITKVSAKLYQTATKNERINSFKWMLLIILLSSIIIVMNLGIDMLENKLAPSFLSQTKLRLLKKILQTNDMGEFIDQVPPIRYRAYVQAISNSTYMIFSNIIKVYVPNAILIFIMLAFLFKLDVLYGMLFLVGGGLTAGYFFLTKQELIMKSTHSESIRRQTDRKCFDILTSLSTVVSKNQANNEYAKMKERIQKMTDIHIKTNHYFSGISYVSTGLISTLIFLTMTVALSKLGTDNPKVVSSVVVALTLMSTLRSKLSGLSTVNLSTAEEVGKSEANVLHALDKKLENIITDPEFDCADGFKIQFDNISFQYDGTNKTVFDNFSWTVQDKQINVLRGASGAGKSTMGKLLLKLYKPTTGTIYINGVDIQKISTKTLRDYLCFVNQDMTLLNLSIHDTLMYANSATDEEVEMYFDQIAKQFQNKTIDSLIGPGGNELSTGQRQLLRVGNATLSSAKCILFDEPCAGLDPQMKQLVLQKIVESNHRNKTIVVITHDSEVANIGQNIKQL